MWTDEAGEVGQTSGAVGKLCDFYSEGDGEPLRSAK